jgi:hypothetical protein
MHRASLSRPSLLALGTFGTFGLLTAFALSATPAQAAQIVVQYSDGASEGFNDPTLGVHRRAAFEFAASIWASTLAAGEIVVDAAMDPLGGSSNSAVLGQAGAALMARDFASAPLAGTWYPIALANQLAGTDLASEMADIIATFNSDVDNETVLGSTDWYYGTDGNAGSDIDFVSVVLHELGHGLGFFDTIDEANGQWRYGFPDVYGLNLIRPDVGQFSAMSDAERLDAIDSENVFWNGLNVVATNGSAARIYAPSSYALGSSISHWDTSLSPDELMEPFYTTPNHDAGRAIDALRDIGWTLDSTPTTTVTSTTTTTTTTTTTILPRMDPFLCYEVKQTKKTPKFIPVRRVDLADQFETTTTDVIKPQVLCNPAALDGATLLDAETHLVGYDIQGTPQHARRKTILVTSAFGAVFVSTTEPDQLLVPSAKSLVSEPEAPDSDTHDLDRFKCYEIKRMAGSPAPHMGLQVTVVDQFTTAKTFTVSKAKRLCNPVDKNGAGIKNQARHLVCYGLKPTKKQPKHVKRLGVYVANELGPGRLDTRKEELLCMPALKTLY